MAARPLKVAVLIVLVVASVLAAVGHAPAGAAANPAPFAPFLGGPTPLPVKTVHYMQEGATVAAYNGMSSLEPTVIHARFTIRTSPYPTGYELNGLSNSGDWYQALVTDNWPGCLPGLSFADEEWSAAGATPGVNCSLTVAFAAGDVVELEIGLNCPGLGPGTYCMSATDLTTGVKNTLSGAQPDAGGSVFVNLPTPANANGYFTGPMTEVIDTTANACLNYAGMPQIDYVIGNASVAPTSYSAWSDEFVVTSTGSSVCYTNFGPVTTLPSTPLTLYMEATGGNALGPHWIASQDWSAVPRQSGGWRLQTDVKPLNLTLAVTPSSLDIGQNGTATGTPSGGAAPYTCQWQIAGFPLTSTACTTPVPAWVVGNQVVHAYLVDSDLDYAEAVGTVTVYARPSVSLSTDPATVIAGQTFTLHWNVTGGRAPFTSNWSGLPAGCTPGSAGNFTCVVPLPGTRVVNLMVTDANNVTQTGSLTLSVVPYGTPPPSTPGPSASALAAAGILILIIAVVLVALFLARRQRQPPPAMPPPVQWPPPVPPPPTGP